MHRQSGNFLLQALLALTLAFSFVPFLTATLSRRDMDAKMYATTRQVDTASIAARIYIRENASKIPYDQTILSGNNFSDVLEPYGLPLGFVPRTALGQDIILIIDKSDTDVSARLELVGGDLSGIRRAELARRIGFYAIDTGETVAVGIPLEAAYSDIVRRNDPDVDAGGFLNDLDMGDNTLDGAGNVIAARGEFETAAFTSLAIDGAENGRKVRSKIAHTSADRTVFQSSDGAAALSLTRGELSAGGVSARTVSKFGDTGNFVSNTAAVYDFEMTAGHTGFVGPNEWNIRGSIVTDKINFSVERVDVSSAINVARGQDVYINTDELEYSTRSGIEAGTVSASNITLRDQTSTGIRTGGDGAVVLDIRPAGTSVLPDALVDTIDNSAFAILASPASDDAKTVDCKSIISDLDGNYNAKSLSQYIICQYVYWQRLERRIDIKQCILNGGGNCG